MFWRKNKGNVKDKIDSGNIFTKSEFSISHNLDDVYNTIKNKCEVYRRKDM